MIGLKKLLATRLTTLVSGQQYAKAFVTKIFLVPDFFEATNRSFWQDNQPLRLFPMVIHFAQKKKFVKIAVMISSNLQ